MDFVSIHVRGPSKIKGQPASRCCSIQNESRPVGSEFKLHYKSIELAFHMSARAP